jgi:hypothetical protein
MSERGEERDTPLLHEPETQPTKVKVVGTFHVPSTWNPGKSLTANGTAERACTFCRLCRMRVSGRAILCRHRLSSASFELN